MAEQNELIEFYGRECPHCMTMVPFIDKLEKETGKKVTRVEVWHHSENAHLMQQVDKGFCGGVPFFYNMNTGKWLCGAVDYGTLKQWALGK